MIPCDGYGRECDHLVDPNRAGVLRQITGWEVVRAEGGANAIVHRRETGRYLCRECGTLFRAGVDPNQTALFEEGAV